MEPKFNTSFIPKKTLQDVGEGGTSGLYVGRRDIYGPGFFLALFLFLVSILATIGLFAYSKIVLGDIEAKLKTLEDKKNIFNTEEISSLIRADKHLSSAKKLVQEHIVSTELLSLLERITLKRVQYVTLEYEGAPTEVAMVLVSGLAKNYQDVALQTEQYRLNSFLKDPIVRQLEQQRDANNVSFEIEFYVDPTLLTLSSILERSVKASSGAGAQTGNQTGLQVEGEVLEGGVMLQGIENTNTTLSEEQAVVNTQKSLQVSGQGSNVEVSGNEVRVDTGSESVRVDSSGATSVTGNGTSVDVNDAGAFINSY